MPATVYLTLDDALFIHSQQIKLFGGEPGIRDPGLIEAALLRPQTGYYDGLIEEASALWESLNMNHGFVDGNKRVAFACTDVFLELNGYAIDADAKSVIEFIYANLENGTFDKTRIQDWLTSHVKRHEGTSST